MLSISQDNKQKEKLVKKVKKILKNLPKCPINRVLLWTFGS